MHISIYIYIFVSTEKKKKKKRVADIEYNTHLTSHNLLSFIIMAKKATKKEHKNAKRSHNKKIHVTQRYTSSLHDSYIFFYF